MGTWGTGIFDNDAALDFVAEIRESGNPKQTLNDALDAVVNAEYLDSDECCAAIVAAAYIDNLINGTKYGGTDDGEFEVDSFGTANAGLDLSDLRPSAVKALQNTFSEQSELDELWKENEGDYPTWRKSIEQLIVRLR